MKSYDEYQSAENALGEIGGYRAFLIDRGGDPELIEALGYALQLIEREKNRLAEETTTENLQPCPCGGAPEYKTEPNGAATIECPVCGKFLMIFDERDRERAAREWNRAVRLRAESEEASEQ